MSWKFFKYNQLFIRVSNKHDKTRYNKEIKKESYIDWEGISEKLSQPLSALDDCNFNHYALQLSIYMYIILKHNPKLIPGKMFIQHISFEEEGKDE